MNEDSVTVRLAEAAAFLDHLYEGSRHIPADLFHPEDERGIVLSRTTDRPISQFFWGGAVEVFLTLGPAVLPLLARWLRGEAEDVTMCDAINERDPDNDGKTRVMYRSQTSNALAVADHILKAKETQT